MPLFRAFPGTPILTEEFSAESALTAEREFMNSAGPSRAGTSGRAGFGPHGFHAGSVSIATSTPVQTARCAAAVVIGRVPHSTNLASSREAVTGTSPLYGPPARGLQIYREAVLRKDGYRVLAASDGKEALGLWDREYAGIDVFVLDVIMPPIGADGLLRN